MLRVTVTLPSGSDAGFSIPQSSKVGDLKALAQQSLGKSFLRLVTAEGRILTDSSELLADAGLRDGDHVLAIVAQARMAATNKAFALWCIGGDQVVTWGDPFFGGDSSEVQHQLKRVRHVQATDAAFAAILEDGPVVTWGYPDDGGDSSAIQGQLKNVQQIQATSRAFAAILQDGSVVTWGDASKGGDSSAVQDQLRNVQQIQSTLFGSFAAILEDGSVVAWGGPEDVGEAYAFRRRLLRTVHQNQAIFEGAFDASNLFAGHATCGVQDQLTSVQEIQATTGAFATILEDGSVLTCGSPEDGGDSSAVQHQLRSVKQIQATAYAFAAILEDGSVVTWGIPEYGGDSSAVQHQLRNL